MQAAPRHNTHTGWITKRSGGGGALGVFTSCVCVFVLRVMCVCVCGGGGGVRTLCLCMRVCEECSCLHTCVCANLDQKFCVSLFHCFPALCLFRFRNRSLPKQSHFDRLHAKHNHHLPRYIPTHSVSTSHRASPVP